MSSSPSFFRRMLNALAIPTLALLTALIAGAIIMLLAGDNPIDAYRGLFQGAFGSARGWSRSRRTVSASPFRTAIIRAVS